MRIKLLIVLGAFLLISPSVNSQVLLSLIFGEKLNSDGIEFGLEGGYNFSDLGTLDADGTLSAFNLGFYFDIRLKDQWRLYTGTLVKMRMGDSDLSDADLAFLGVEKEDEEGTYQQQVGYFLVPALLNYRFDNRLYVEIGPQFGLRHQAKVVFEAEDGDRSTRVEIKNKDATNPIEVGASAGFGYRFREKNSMSIGVRYFYGFTNVYKGVNGSNNRSLFIKLNVPIGAGKKKEKEEEKSATDGS
ncbi:porin family protein [Aureitalea marina]|uniref:Outer membrane protein beta-barrel domain-containing protein n=1 Tax=Aureitalea marina TaxID=930804 RepID=A0A2S7KTM1_9FLAO|nr:porin family protein [Aureitalea marina]PQB05991.1 hypothetical protein BST85_06970 [Aureitalea marina]